MKRIEKFAVLLSIRDLCESILNGDLPSSEIQPIYRLAHILSIEDKKEFSETIENKELKKVFDYVCGLSD